MQCMAILHSGHVAASLGSDNIVSVILAALPTRHDLCQIVEMRNKLKEAPVHCAAARGHLSVMKTLYDKFPNCIELEGRFNGLPLHSACGYGRIEVVKMLMEWNPEQLETPSIPVDLPSFTTTTEAREWDEGENPVDVTDTIEKLSLLIISIIQPWHCIRTSENEGKNVNHLQYTPLTRASQFGRLEIVEFLITKGAKSHPLAVIKAIEGSYEECVRLLLFSAPEKRFSLIKEILKFEYIPVDSPILTTPFRELIKHMPDTAEALLHKCTRHERFLVNSKNFKIKIDYELVDDGTINWNTIDEANEQSVYNDYVKCHPIEETEEIDAQYRRLNSGRLRCMPHTGFNKETHPLSLMVQYKRIKLLTHPVVASLIHDKWRSSYGVFSFVHWLLYLIFVIITNTVLGILRSPNNNHCIQGNGTDEDLCGRNMTDDVNDCNTDHSYSPGIIYTLAGFVLIYSFMRLLMELVQAVASMYLGLLSVDCCKKDAWFDLMLAIKRMNYFWDLTNWVELVLFTLATALAIIIMSNKELCIDHQNWTIAAIVTWLSWVELIFVSTQFQIIGVYAIMFTKVFKTLLKLIPLASIMIIGFGLTFHFLLYKPEIKASPYYSPGYSLLKILSMTTGDLNADSFFGLDYHGKIHDTMHLEYLGLSTFFWIASLILMTVLLSNLLIGLAVGDIQSIHDQAKFEKLALQVDYVLTAENNLTLLKQCPGGKCLKKFGNKGCKEIEPNCKHSKWDRILDEFIYLLWGGIRCDSYESIQSLTDYKLTELD